MRVVAAFLLLASACFSTEPISIFGYSWTVPDAADWKIDTRNGAPVLHLLVGKEPPATGPRRPFQFAIANTPAFRTLRIEADVKPLARSLMLVYAYADAAHFDYAHLSTDTATKEPHHNGVFHVFGGERVRISAIAGPAAFLKTQTWHHAVLNWDGETGTVDVQVNGVAVPALHAVDVSLKTGRIGLGSFDETGDFKNVKISGTP